QAERVLALDLDGGAADAGDVAGRLFHDLGLEALPLAVLEVLAQQHRRPVARLGAAGAGLDVDEAVARIERVVEHAPELELGDRRLELGGVGLDAEQAVDVAFLLRHLVQLAVVGEVRGEVVDRRDDRVERALLATELLGALRLVPDVRVLEGGVDLVQPQRFAVVVKDTPGGRPCASSGRPGGCRWHWCVRRPWWVSQRRGSLRGGRDSDRNASTSRAMSSGRSWWSMWPAGPTTCRCGTETTLSR